MSHFYGSINSNPLKEFDAKDEKITRIGRNLPCSEGFC